MWIVFQKYKVIHASSDPLEGSWRNHGGDAADNVD